MNRDEPAPGRMDAATGRWLAERYEALRSANGAGQTQGRWVLMTRGMAEWARVCASCAGTGPAARQPRVASACGGPSEGFAAGEAAEIVRVWAAMVWQIEQEGQR